MPTQYDKLKPKLDKIRFSHLKSAAKQIDKNGLGAFQAAQSYLVEIGGLTVPQRPLIFAASREAANEGRFRIQKKDFDGNADQLIKKWLTDQFPEISYAEVNFRLRKKFLVNIGNPEGSVKKDEWWEQNRSQSMITAGFGDKPGGRGEAKLKKFASDDTIFAYVSKKGVVGMGRARGPSTYEFDASGVAPGYSTHRHMAAVEWLAWVDDPSGAIGPSVLREIGIRPNQMCIEIPNDAANALTGLIEADQRFTFSTSTDETGHASLRLVKAPKADSKGEKRSGRKSYSSKIDYLLRNSKNKALGDVGELAVLVYEREKLKAAKRFDLARKVQHIAIKNDSAGYDIKSFTESGSELMIEVKTTTGGEASPFFLSANELETCRQAPAQYQIARVLNFNPRSRIGDVFIISGNRLLSLQRKPVTYQINPKHLGVP